MTPSELRQRYPTAWAATVDWMTANRDGKVPDDKTVSEFMQKTIDLYTPDCWCGNCATWERIQKTVAGKCSECNGIRHDRETCSRWQSINKQKEK
jgi:hypothetical protein